MVILRHSAVQPFNSSRQTDFLSSPIRFSISDLDECDVMTVGHWLHNHGDETKNNFHSMMQS